MKELLVRKLTSRKLWAAVVGVVVSLAEGGSAFDDEGGSYAVLYIDDSDLENFRSETPVFSVVYCESGTTETEGLEVAIFEGASCIRLVGISSSGAPTVTNNGSALSLVPLGNAVSIESTYDSSYRKIDGDYKALFFFEQ